jgi:signal transduction histidine kinase
MSVRIRITLFFTLLVFIILGLVCGTVYYISYTNRTKLIQTRLSNRAITTARLLSQIEVFDPKLLQRIDAATTLALKNKSVQVFDYRNERLYAYSEIKGDTIQVPTEMLDDARVKGSVYFTANGKEAVAYHYVDQNVRLVTVAAAWDQEGLKTQRQLFLILLFACIGGTITAFGVGYFFSYRLLRPIRKITDEVNEITAQNFTRRIATTQTKDEWNYLAHTLNKLLDRLQDSFELQQRFIANASHELSTPLTSISSQLEVSLQRSRNVEEYQLILQSVLQDVRHMNKLTQTLLEFAKAAGTSGGLEINILRIDEVLMRLPADLAKINKAYSVQLSFDELPVNEEYLLVYGNDELLFTAIKNIVNNACKYSPDHEAQISLNIKSQSIIINIKDRGIGISGEDINKIFQPFYRVDESRHTEGFGLGLALAHRIIKLHKGTLEVVSEPNHGSTFTITLPIASTIQ